MQKRYLEKVYSGIVGKAMGVILGAPVEPTIWTYEKIYETYGEIQGYVKQFKNFAADDDLNGPIFFLKALSLVKKDQDFESQHVGKAWLNYAREGIGMFWWGGYGTSTEHTAFLNLKKGLNAPQSGSEEVNGTIIAEQIGGQIFIDTWGLIAPGDIDKAADYAEKAARVSHDKNGVYGARFVAACIAKAFDTQEIREVIEAGLSVIPDDSEYKRVCDAVIHFYEADKSKDFRKALAFLHDEFGYDKYPGVCHIIPNSGVMMVAMLYGEGKLDRTIEVATMCGWDTDCNAGNVGTILGVMNGFEGLEKRYFDQINDVIIASSAIGSENIIDIPTLAKEVARYGYELSGQAVPDDILEVTDHLRELHFDFNLKGTTHGFRTTDSLRYPVRPVEGKGVDGSGALAILLDRVYRGNVGRVYYKPFYRREDFDDERYQPAFSPKVYSGQTLSTRLYLDKWNGDDIGVTPYVRCSHSKALLKGKMVTMPMDQWTEISFEIPDTEGQPIDEVGIEIESFTRERFKVLGNLYMDRFDVTGKGYHRIDFDKEKTEFKTTTQFTENAGAFSIEGDSLHMITNEDAIAITGNYYMKDLICQATLIPQYQKNDYLAIRVEGIKRHYLAGFSGDKVVIIKNDFGLKCLAEMPYPCQIGKAYDVKVSVIGQKISLMIDNEHLLEVVDEDDPITHGGVGYSVLDNGRLKIKELQFKEL